MRIASFVPAATELLASLGVRRRLVGVTHSCAGVTDLSGLDLRLLTRCRVPQGASSSAIDGAVKTAAANHSEVQVFDAEGRYITHWGSQGSAPGQFDFGTGNQAADFNGAVVVGADGFIYVADPGNRRVQKFAP